MDAYGVLQVIQRLARIALASEQGQSAEVLVDIQRAPERHRSRDREFIGKGAVN